MLKSKHPIYYRRIHNSIYLKIWPNYEWNCWPPKVKHTSKSWQAVISECVRVDINLTASEKKNGANQTNLCGVWWKYKQKAFTKKTHELFFVFVSSARIMIISVMMNVCRTLWVWKRSLVRHKYIFCGDVHRRVMLSCWCFTRRRTNIQSSHIVLISSACLPKRQHPKGITHNS